MTNARMAYLDDVLPLLFASIFDLLANQTEDILHDWVKERDKGLPWRKSTTIPPIAECVITGCLTLR